MRLSLPSYLGIPHEVFYRRALFMIFFDLGFRPAALRGFAKHGGSNYCVLGEAVLSIGSAAQAPGKIAPDHGYSD